MTSRDQIKRKELIDQRLEKERERNEQFLKQSLGKPVNYNEKVHLLHAESGYYLDTESEATERNSFSLILSPNASKSTVFSLLPIYNSEILGEKIQANDGFRILHRSTGFYLNYSMIKGYKSMLDLNLEQGLKRETSPLDIFNYPEDENPSCVILAEKSIIWASKLIRTFDQDDDDKIVSNDIVRIKFPHFGSEFAADYSYLGEKPDQEEIFSKKYIGPHEEEFKAMKGVWMIHKKVAKGTSEV